jgi:hypothetical protein
MRGPLLSGPIGSPATLERLGAILQPKAPAVVLSSVWLAAELATAMPALLLVEPEGHRDAKRAARKAKEAGRGAAAAAPGAPGLLAVVAGEQVPLRPGAVGALVVESLAELDEGAAGEYLLGLAEALAPDGFVVALDGTKDPAVEARVAGAFLAAGLRAVAQERPREGALLTFGRAPAPEVLAARLAGE